MRKEEGVFVELSEFIKASLLEVTRGVRDSQQVLRELGAVANPATASSQERVGPASYVTTIDEDDLTVAVSFDIAVTVIQTGDEKFLQVPVGGDVEEIPVEITETISRVRFEVPLSLPVDEESKSSLEAKKKAEQEAIKKAHDEFDVSCL